MVRKKQSTSTSLELIEESQAQTQKKVEKLHNILNRALENISEHYALSHEMYSELKKDTHEYLILQSLGVDLSAVPLPRFIPIRIYTSESDKKKTQEISNAMFHLLKIYGFIISDDFPEESGSWWKKWFAKTVDYTTKHKLTEKLNKIVKAVELKGIHKPQSEINKNEAEAVASLIKSIENSTTAAIQVGTILLVKTNHYKTDTCIQARNLTPREQTYLEENQRLLDSPNDILIKLENLNK